MKKNISFYKKQVELLDISLEILTNGFNNKWKNFNDKYKELLYRHIIPPHIYQPITALRNKIQSKIEYYHVLDWLEVPHAQWVFLIRTFWCSFIIENKNKIRELLKQYSITKTIDILYKL